MERRKPLQRGTGFLRMPPPRAARAPMQPVTERFRPPSPIDPNAIVRPLPKTAYVRSELLLAEVRALPSCQHCGRRDLGVQPAHSNWHQHGKGGQIKADDRYVAALCPVCHQMIDQGSRLLEEERQRIWWFAFVSTVALLIGMRRWPVAIPRPDMRNPFPWAPRPPGEQAAGSTLHLGER